MYCEQCGKIKKIGIIGASLVSLKLDKKLQKIKPKLKEAML